MGSLAGRWEPLTLHVRAEMEAGKNPPYAYIGRNGTLQLPFDDAVAIAQKCCAAEPSTVLARSAAVERECRERNASLSHLAEARAAWALVRQRTGHVRR